VLVSTCCSMTSVIVGMYLVWQHRPKNEADINQTVSGVRFSCPASYVSLCLVYLPVSCNRGSVGCHVYRRVSLRSTGLTSVVNRRIYGGYLALFIQKLHGCFAGISGIRHFDNHPHDILHTGILPFWQDVEEHIYDSKGFGSSS
jgi:hypothetical protein